MSFRGLRIMLLTFILIIIISIPSPPHSFVPAQNIHFLQILLTVASFFFLETDHMDSPDCFTVISEHICFLLLVFFLFLHFLVVGCVRWIKLTHVGFRAYVKIASRIVSYRK